MCHVECVKGLRAVPRIWSISVCIYSIRREGFKSHSDFLPYEFIYLTIPSSIYLYIYKYNGRMFSLISSWSSFAASTRNALWICRVCVSVYVGYVMDVFMLSDDAHYVRVWFKEHFSFWRILMMDVSADSIATIFLLLKHSGRDFEMHC